jgi:hypothetical protein
MINKILVWWGIALTAILIIENMVVPSNAYFFIDSSSKAWIVALTTNIIWVAMWYWFSWMLQKKGDIEDDLDF